MMNHPSGTDGGPTVFEAHGRSFEDNRYVYPVVSRRSHGVSVGVNLSLTKHCNFGCAYCQVDRTHHAGGDIEPIDLARLRSELESTIEVVLSGAIYEGPRFRRTPPAYRRLRDVALSGDGEATLHVDFARAVSVCVDVLNRQGLHEVKLVLITNASMLHRPRVCGALDELNEAGGEIWAKLDAGTEDYYRTINRSPVPFRQILGNLREAAIERPLVIQSLFARLFDEPPPVEEQEAYCDRLNEIVAAGGKIKLVQVHTVARIPAESWVSPLLPEEVDELAERVRRRTGLTVEAYGGTASSDE